VARESPGLGSTRPVVDATRRPVKLTRGRLLGASLGTTLVVAIVPAIVLALQGVDVNGREGRAVFVFQSFAPLLGALVGEAVIRRADVAKRLGMVFEPSRLWLVAWWLPILGVIFGVVATWAFGVDPILTLDDLVRAKRALVPVVDRVAFDRTPPTQPPYLLLAMALPGSVLNLFPALALEIGLRGFFYRELPGGFFARSFSIGLLHAAVVAPLTMLGWGFEESALVAVPLVVLRTGLYALVAVYVRARTGSVYAVALFSATYLALSRPAIDLTLSAPTWLRPLDGLAGSLGLAALFAACAWHDRYVAKQKLIFAPERASAARASAEVGSTSEEVRSGPN